MISKTLLPALVLSLGLAGCHVSSSGPVCGDGYCDPGEGSFCSDCGIASVCTLEVENDISFFGANYTIYEISLRDAGAGSYGGNLLDTPLAFNYFVSLGNWSPGYYDLLTIDEDGDWYEFQDFYCAPDTTSRWSVGALDCTTC